MRDPFSERPVGFAETENINHHDRSDRHDLPRHLAREYLKEKPDLESEGLIDVKTPLYLASMLAMIIYVFFWVNG